MLWRYAQHLYHSYGELWLARIDELAATIGDRDRRARLLAGAKVRALRAVANPETWACGSAGPTPA